MRPLRGQCRYCGQPVIWAVTVSGKRIPLDPTPTADGRILLTGGEALVITTGMNPPTERLRYDSHFTSCVPYGKAAMPRTR